MMDFTSEPPHSTKLVHVHGERPFNAEPDLAELIQHHATPANLIYARNHCAYFVDLRPTKQ
jgi:hypothetical protein